MNVVPEFQLLSEDPSLPPLGVQIPGGRTDAELQVEGARRMTSRNQAILACIVLVSLSLIRTCAGGNGAPGPSGPAGLAGTEWALTSLHGRGLIEETEITLYFRETYLGGAMTCNQYGGGPDSGRCTATEDGTLTLPGGLAVTMQLCSEPEGIMEQEATYIEALRDVAAYRIVDQRLEILDASDQTILVFESKE